jgi:peptide deformylase
MSETEEVMIDSVTIVPDPTLRIRCEPVVDFEFATKLATKMLYIVKKLKASGLSANQVAYDARMFVTNPTGEVKDMRVYINPTILYQSSVKKNNVEGCLSIPDKKYRVKRSNSIEVRAQDVAGHWFTQKLKGQEAFVFLHEIEHLDGILISDRGRQVKE